MQDIITVNVDLTTAAFKTITGDFKLFGFKTFNDIANTIIVNHATEYYTHLEHLENEITRVLEEHNIPNRTNYALLPKLVLISERYDRPRDTLQSKNIVIQKDYVETFIALEDYFNDLIKCEEIFDNNNDDDDEFYLKTPIKSSKKPLKVKSLYTLRNLMVIPIHYFP